MNKKVRILWADDEIELLKPHIMFLTSKGYEVVPVNNGGAAIDLAKEEHFDIIFLDEQMPGISGLDALPEIKQVAPNVPVVMITKSEAENIMDAAIGSKIADYLIKPVNPNQILLSLKKNLERGELITQKTTSNYQMEFTRLGMQIGETRHWSDWVDMYRKLIYWDLELEPSNDSAMKDILKTQKLEANHSFAKFVKNNYLAWMDDKNVDKPLLSPSVVKQKLLPNIQSNKKTLFLVIDNLRYDQWVLLRALLQEFYTVDDDDIYYSILPTTTQYCRNSLFAGLMPDAIEKIYPELWVNDSDDEMKNQYEEALFNSQLRRLGVNIKPVFEKVTAASYGRKLLDKIPQFIESPLSVIIYNFVDTLSHARTEMDMIKELAADETAYRSLTVSWFKHSPLFELLRELSQHKVSLVITTDHGSVHTQNPIKVLADKTVTNNLRYKQGKALQYNAKEVFEVKQPSKAHLPSTNISSTYIFALCNDFLVYPNNYSQFAKYYKDTFQHGGVSLEEMLIPIVSLQPKG